MQSRSLAGRFNDLRQWSRRTFISPLFDPWARVRCPYCLKEFYPGHAAIVSKRILENGTYKVLEPAPPTQGWRGYLARLWVKPLDGLANMRDDVRRQCPNPDCNKLWPPYIERAENHIIAILGARGSGKSCYIAVTIQALTQALAFGPMRANGFRPLNEEIAKVYYDTYYRYLESHRPILQTQQATSVNNQPLMYELTLEKHSESGLARRVNIIIYDASGEDLANPDRVGQYLPHVFHASAIIYFADPLAIDSIWTQLNQQQMEGIGDRPDRGIAEVLTGLTPELERVHHFRPFPGPVAIALSKSDLVEYIPSEDGGDYLFASRPAYAEPGGKIRQQEFITINNEVIRLLKELDLNTQRQNDLERRGDALLAASNRFPKKMFFAVSATGCPPTKGVFDKFQPRRCLDPLLWILCELGIIEAA